MKKIPLTLFCLFSGILLWAQPAAKAPVAPELVYDAPPGSIDLLKKSLSGSDIQNTGSYAPPSEPYKADNPRLPQASGQPSQAMQNASNLPAEMAAIANQAMSFAVANPPAGTAQNSADPSAAALPAQPVGPTPALTKPAVVSNPPGAAKPAQRLPAAKPVPGADTASKIGKPAPALVKKVTPTPLKKNAQPGAKAVSKTSATPNPKPKAKPAAAAVPANMLLQMPIDLNTGSVVTAPVPASAIQKPKPTARQVNKKVTLPVKKAAEATPKKVVAAPTPEELAVEQQNALLPGSGPDYAAMGDLTKDQERAAAEAELAAAQRMLQAAKSGMAEQQRKIAPPAAQTVNVVPPAAPVTISQGPFNPNDYRPGVMWDKRDSTHFTIYTQKRSGGIGSSNMGMIFESAYDTLRRNIPWMMSGDVRVFVYENHDAYLRHEPNAHNWSRALAYPTRGEVVVYDEPGKQQELKEAFTHELVHIFTQQFFDKHKTNRIMTPLWLDEGLAVMMEDQAYNGVKGGPWSQDFKTLNFQRSKESEPTGFKPVSMFGPAKKFSTKRKGPEVFFAPFNEFMKEDSLAFYESTNKTQDWYFQAYAMVRFLLNPANGSSPTNRMQFEQFTRLLAQGEVARDPRSGFPLKDANGKPLYQPYSAEKALGKAYRYNSASNFEDAFWRWADNEKSKTSAF